LETKTARAAAVCIVDIANIVRVRACVRTRARATTGVHGSGRVRFHGARSASRTRGSGGVGLFILYAQTV
jgi:hypothetical protein